MTVPAVQSVGAIHGAESLSSKPSSPTVQMTPRTSFAQMLSNGIDQVNHKLIGADATVKAFVLDDSIPLHQVMFALAEARDSFEMMLQVRTKLLGAYQELTRMQL